MAGNSQVLGLIVEMLDSGKTPEEVCCDCPDLLPAVQQRWQEFCRIDAGVRALLPGLGTLVGADAITPMPCSAGLPQVPGYEVEAVLGRGGMGVVYKARHLALKRTVALKMMAGHSDPADRVRFKVEAEAVARLQHPNIVQIYEIGEANGVPFFALEFVEGGSLANRLADRSLPPRDAARLVTALADAMHLAHSRNFIHRDLKPANVLLTGGADTPIDQCQPKVTDFGIARQLDADSGQTQVGAIMGTPSYMAPEQAEGRAHAAGPAADVYALGAILYECLTGRPPFQGATPLETLEQVRSREPAAPSALDRQAPRDLETICLKCLRKEPEWRYSSARELAEDLGRFVRGEPILARPVGAAERVQKWVWRRPAAAGLLVAVLLLLAAGGIGASLVYQQRAAASARQAQTDQEARRVLEQARDLLAKGWQVADLGKLTEAEAEGSRAMSIARSGGASAGAQREAEAFSKDAAGRLGRAQKNRDLMEAVLDVGAPQETDTYVGDKAGRLMVLAHPSVDEQYAAAFRRWGLDVDGTAEDEVVARLGTEPAVVTQELIAALDNWALERRRQKRPEAEWQRLLRVAERLDPGEEHRRLRGLLFKGSLPRAEAVAGLAGVGSPWPAIWELARGNAWRELQEVRTGITPRTEPVLTVVLLGRALAAVGDGAGAEELLRRAAAARPGQVLLLDALGKLLEGQGASRREEAIGYYRTARGQHHHLGLSLSTALLRIGRPAEAEEVLQELVLQQPDNPMIYLDLGIAVDRQSKYDKAEAAYRQAIARNADFVEAYNNLGITLAHRGKPGDAEAAFRKATDLKPDYALAHFNLGVLLTGQQRRDEAAVAYRKATAHKPGFAEAYVNLGMILARQRKFVDAEPLFRRAIGLRPDLAEAYYGLGTALAGQEKPAEAEAAFRQAIARKTDYAEAYANLGTTLNRQQKLDDAEAAFRTATELQPAMPEPHFNLGRALMQRAQFQEAAASLKKATDLLPAQDPRLGQARQFQQQCQRFAILNARLPMILKGLEKPADYREQYEFALLCITKKLFTAAARFARDAFTAEPRLADAVPTGTRYFAACAAAQAGGGQGKDAKELDDKERALWRRQALDWLSQDLTWWGKALESGNARTRSLVRPWMLRWRTNPDLDSVRAKDALARLPDEDRDQWERLWSDVDALLRRAGAPE
jgi:serine/threonine-protein kinase